MLQNSKQLKQVYFVVTLFTTSKERRLMLSSECTPNYQLLT